MLNKTVIVPVILLIAFTLVLTGCPGPDSAGFGGSGGSGESTPSLPMVVISGITAGETQLSLAWTDPVLSSYDHIEITCDGMTENVAVGIETYTRSGLSASTSYLVSVVTVDSSSRFSEANEFTISTTDGTFTTSYLQIHTADDLNAVRGGVAGYDDWGVDECYLLMNDIDLSGYASGEGWVALGGSTYANAFNGSVMGNGFAIRNLTISRSEDYQGLFGYIKETAVLENIDMVDVSVSGQRYSAGLTAFNYHGRIADCSVSGVVDGDSDTGGLIGNASTATVDGCVSTATVTGNDNVGGLIGNFNTGTLNDSRASGDVTGNNTVGGLAGYCHAVVMTESSAAGNVSGVGYTGGLVGAIQNGELSDSFATGTVTGTLDRTGGLAGLMDSLTVSNCYATGIVSGIDNTGGLVGGNSSGAIEQCHASGTVSGENYVGGLAGYNTNGTVTESLATGDVSATVNYAGGLIGYNSGGGVDNSYALGNVTSTGNNNGGLVGYNTSSITNCHSTGAVSGNLYIGGLVGFNTGTVTASFYDSDTSGQSDTGKGEPATTAEMTTQATFTDAGWDFAGETVNGIEDIWSISGAVQSGYPYLVDHPFFTGD